MTSELAAVEQLLIQILPDPRGFAERILGELMERVATPAPSGRPTVTTSTSPSPDDGVRAGVEALGDRVLLLAAALGACDCWGEQADCPDCSGSGRPGWVPPDPELYQEFVAPAARRAGPAPEFRPHPRAGSPTEPGLHPHSQPEGDQDEHLLG